MKKYLIISIFFLAIFFRLQNLNWDANMHLHPDERFLTMVGNAMKLPPNFAVYLNSAVSTWNPANIGYPFFVYGLFPLTINKIFALLLNTDSYNSFTLQGRLLSGIFDIIALFFIYKIGSLLRRKYKLSDYFPIFSVFLYAIAVYPIQSSHFFTTDTFLNTFLLISFYASFVFYIKERLSYFILSALFFGLAISSKMSAVYMFPIIALMNVIPLIKKRNLLIFILYSFIYILVLYGVIRIASPYYFETDDIFNIAPNSQFLKSISDLRFMSSGKMLFPPAVQWFSKKPILFSLFNLSFIGFGILPFVLSLIGGFTIVRLFVIEIMKKRLKYFFDCLLGISIILWIAGYFIYNSIQFTQSIRYLIFLFPFLALLGGYGLSSIKIKKQGLRYILFVGLLIWPLAFSSIYLFSNTRIEASRWIYKNIPNNSIILSEYWDDPLPYPVLSGKQFQIEQMHVFDPDVEEKWNIMNTQLQKADYYILSSNRGWGSIPSVPDKYPKMSIFYSDLFSGKTDYFLEKRFIPAYQYFLPFYPNSWINNWFEEAFTVYDHPSVFIYKNKNK